MNVAALIALAFALAFLAESMVEYVFGTIVDKVPKLAAWRWLLMYVALAVGCLMAYHYHLDMVAMIAELADFELSPTWLGTLLTGLAIGRGSNYIHQFMSEHLPKRS